MIAAKRAVRVCAIALGLIGMGWGIADYSNLRREAVSSNIATRILAGDPFKSSILLNQASLLEQAQQAEGCRPLEARSAALIRLRLAELSNDPSLTAGPVRSKIAVEAIRHSLACSPADPFLWLVLYSLEPAAQLGYLSASYRLGPNEGWIAVKRNPVAFEAFDELPEDLRGRVVQEFVRLLEIELYDAAVKIFVGAAWDKRELILSKLDRLPLPTRQMFAEALAAADYDVTVPGTTLKTNQ